MNFVDLVNRVKVECGVSGPTVATLQGSLPREIERLKGWVQSSWEEVQSRHVDWTFLRIESGRIVNEMENIVASDEVLADSVERFVCDSFRIGSNNAGRDASLPLTYVEYQEFRNGIGLNPEPRGRPVAVTMRPHDRVLMLAPTPDGTYELHYDYIRTPQILTNDDDEPIVASKHHMIIVWNAMIRYGRYEAASEILSDAMANYRRMFASLEVAYLPEMKFGAL